jgi:hypothetical protein
MKREIMAIITELTIDLTGVKLRDKESNNHLRPGGRG